VVATQEGLAAGLFAAQPAVFAHVAVVGGEVVGVRAVVPQLLHWPTWPRADHAP
jgi:hypothetical protein